MGPRSSQTTGCEPSADARRRPHGFTAFHGHMLNQPSMPALDRAGRRTFTRQVSLSHRDSKFFDLGEGGSHVGVGRLHVDVVGLDGTADNRISVLSLFEGAHDDQPELAELETPTLLVVEKDCAPLRLENRDARGQR